MKYCCFAVSGRKHVLTSLWCYCLLFCLKM